MNDRSAGTGVDEIDLSHVLNKRLRVSVTAATSAMNFNVTINASINHVYVKVQDTPRSEE
jgi:hypothetical protein